MRKFKILGIAMFAVFAFGAISAASAFAAHEWLTLAGTKLTEAKEALTDGTLFLHHTPPAILGGGKITFECVGQFHGTVGPGSLDLVTDVLGSEGSLDNATTKTGIKCKVSESTNALCTTSSTATLVAENLPWSTELVLEGTTTYNDLTADGKGEPAYESTCGSISTLCHLSLDRSKWLGNDADGALFKFGGELTASCNDGGTGTTLGEGLVLSFNVS